MTNNTVPDPNTQRNNVTSPSAGNNRAHRNGRSNRNGKGGSRNSNTNQKNENVKTNSNFRGSVKEMNGHVFQLHSEAVHKNQYSRTIDELASYIGIHFKRYPADVKRMTLTLTETIIPRPKDPPESATKFDIRLWEKDVDLYATRLDAYRTNKCTLYSIIWSQCSESMQSKLKSTNEFEAMADSNDSLGLLQMIKGIAYRFESQSNIYLALDEAKCSFYTYYQGHDESNATYLSKFKDIIQVIEHYGGNIGDDEVLVAEELKKLKLDSKVTTSSDLSAATETAKQKSHAIAFLKRADKHRYGILTTDLANLYSRGTDQYPTTITEAYNMLVTYKKPVTQNTRGPPTPASNVTRPREPTAASTLLPVTEDLSFVQQASPPPIESIQCYNCQEYGHYKSDCNAKPVPRSAATLLFQQATNIDSDAEDSIDNAVGFSFHQTKHNDAINPSWVLLDSESTVSIFCNKNFLTNVRHCGHTGIRIHTNGGHKDVDMIGDLAGFGEVWYHPKSLANILSLAAVRKICRITMDTRNEAALVVHKHNGTELKFYEHFNGLYYHDTKATPHSKQNFHMYTLLHSVTQNESLFTKRQVHDARLARRSRPPITRYFHTHDS